MHIARKLLVVTFIVLLFGASIGTTEEMRVTLNGTVSHEGGTRIGGARVTVLDSNGKELASAVTDDSGAFRLTDLLLRPGDYSIQVAVGRKVIARQRLHVPDDLKLDATSIDIIAYERRYKARPPETAPPPPPPVMSDPGPTKSAPPPGENFTRVRVFYATDRNTTGDAAPASFYGGDRAQPGALRYGSCEVSIPRHHVEGELEAPSIWRFEFRENPEKHVVLMSVHEAEPELFYSELKSRVLESVKREAFVFIHGYNVTFEDAARRTAQLSYDLKYDAAPVLYSWPSAGSTARYIQDEQNVEWTVPHLKEFLSEVQRRSGASVVHLIAHSMGNRALVNALQSLPVEEGGPRFQQIVLAAPDIDREIFAGLAQKVIELSQRVTLYSSMNDEALVMSRTVHGYPRLGESVTPIFIHKGIDTIDASAVKTGFLGHSYYGDSRTVLEDLVSLLKEGLTPDLRRLKRLETPGVYWAIAQ